MGKRFFRKNKSLFIVFILFLIIISIMQFSVKEIIGFDGWLHIKTADIIKNQGFIKEFPYTTESILNQNYSDLQLGFRILLIPFTYNLIHGAKMASILFAALCFTFFYWYLKKNNISYPLFWTSLYSIISVNLMYRFLLPRAMPLAILSLILTFYFIDEKMYKSLLVTSLLFTWIYHGFIFQLLVIAVYFTINLLIYKKLDLKIIAYPLTGTLIALIINPYFPNNLSLLFTQFFKVNLIGNVYNMEWRPWPILELFKNNYILLTLFTTAFFYNIKNTKINKQKLLFLTLSILTLIAMLKTRRMHEYFAPFTILFAAFSLNKLQIRKYIKYTLTLTIIIITIFTLINLKTHIKNNHFLPWYKEGAEWTRNNIPTNSKVFINSYTFNYLFFNNPNLRYTHGIDLTYSYLKDKDKFKRYMATLQGTYPPYNIIKQDYNVDYAIVGKIKQDIKLFQYIIKHKEDFELVYEDENVGILKVK